MTMSSHDTKRDVAREIPIPSPLGGERVRVRGARRTRTTAARDFARYLRKKSTDRKETSLAFAA